jgi:hypothetical protein
MFSFGTGQGGSQPGVTSSMTYPIAHDAEQPSTGIFANKVFTTADTGKTVAVVAGDPGFAQMTAKLTNGIDEMLTFWFIPAPAVNISGQGWHEPFVVWHSNADPRVDLHGQTIAMYTLRQDSLTTTFDAGTGRSTFDAHITFTAYDQVPEPGGAAGTLALLHLARRRGRRACL